MQERKEKEALDWALYKQAQADRKAETKTNEKKTQATLDAYMQKAVPKNIQKIVNKKIFKSNLDTIDEFLAMTDNEIQRTGEKNKATPMDINSVKRKKLTFETPKNISILAQDPNTPKVIGNISQFSHTTNKNSSVNP